MHYPNSQCAPKNGVSFTLKQEVEGSDKIGKYIKLSDRDIQHINRAHCPSTFNFKLIFSRTAYLKYKNYNPIFNIVVK